MKEIKSLSNMILQIFEPNLPVTVVNGDEVAGSSRLIIERTLEPTLIEDGKVLDDGKSCPRQEGLNDVSRD